MPHVQPARRLLMSHIPSAAVTQQALPRPGLPVQGLHAVLPLLGILCFHDGDYGCRNRRLRGS